MQWLDVSAILKESTVNNAQDLEFILQYLDYWNGKMLNL